ncbi:negative regulation of formation of translation preinitiation complex [Basidiobolus ranarum]|uniref:Negative regulation of formation of translation preinitiation complex n=1 Tax=Basidiobolus ranarum TaxID=34480 RepID=A0ABR2X292_9FUNG
MFVIELFSRVSGVSPGMIPHKTARGTAAIEHLKLFRSISPPYDTIKHVVIPATLSTLRFKPERKHTALNCLSSEVD